MRPHTSSLTAGLRDTFASARRRRSPSPEPVDPFWAHSYFTDGVHLYRFLGWVHRSADTSLAEFEDCRSFDTVLVRIRMRTDSLPEAAGLWPLLPAR